MVVIGFIVDVVVAFVVDVMVAEATNKRLRIRSNSDA